MKKIVLLALAILLCMSSIAFGYVMGASNLGYNGYPQYGTYNKPFRPYSRDDYSDRNYRQQVDDYVAKGKEYVDACDNDVKRIAEARQDAINSVNAVINEYNDYIKGW